MVCVECRACDKRNRETKATMQGIYALVKGTFDALNGGETIGRMRVYVVVICDNESFGELGR